MAGRAAPSETAPLGPIFDAHLVGLKIRNLFMRFSEIGYHTSTRVDLSGTPRFFGSSYDYYCRKINKFNSLGH
jgi:hypothetical protein